MAKNTLQKHQKEQLLYELVKIGWALQVLRFWVFKHFICSYFLPEIYLNFDIFGTVAMYFDKKFAEFLAKKSLQKCQKVQIL